MARVQGCLFPPAMKCGLDPLVEAPSPLVLRLFIPNLARGCHFRPRHLPGCAFYHITRNPLAGFISLNTPSGCVFLKVSSHSDWTR